VKTLASTNHPISVGEFLESALRHQLVNQKQLDRVLATMPLNATLDTITLDTITQRLLHASLLTPFQIQRLLARKTDGYFVGSYLILEPIGRSSGGHVYKARHRTMNRHVAIKILSPQLSQSQQLLDAFHYQTRIAAKLIHPNIITTYDAARMGNRCYAVLEYFDGVTLQTLVEQRVPISLTEVCAIANQLRQALAYAHTHGIAHGALKPSQVLLGRSSLVDGTPLEVKILNFGLSCLSRFVESSATHKLDHAMSAADYTAPEALLKTDAPTSEGDTYSLGCVIYFLLTGSPPRPRSQGLHQQVGYVPIQQLRPDLDRTICAGIEQLLATKPSARPNVTTAWSWLSEPAGKKTDTGSVDWSLATRESSELSGGYLTGFTAPTKQPTDIPQLNDETPIRERIPRGLVRRESWWPIATLVGSVIVCSGLLILLVVRAMNR
jgi:eukaryotic-like serine/threonine-protein kinase